MSFLIPLPKPILESNKIILLPQLSSKENLLKLKPKYFTTGPKVFDCFTPLIGKEGELLISPFLGHVGICTILEQILKQSKADAVVSFFGTCGGCEGNELELGSIVSPNSFYIEEKLEEISCVKNVESDLSILSTSFISHESFPKLMSLNAKYNICLIDMELAFVQRICQLEHIQLTSFLLVTDIWTEYGHAPSPKSVKSLPAYKDFIDLIISNFE